MRSYRLYKGIKFIRIQFGVSTNNIILPELFFSLTGLEFQYPQYEWARFFFSQPVVMRSKGYGPTCRPPFINIHDENNAAAGLFIVFGHENLYGDPFGRIAGGLYFPLTFLVVLLRTFFVLLYGYVRLPRFSPFSGICPEKENRPPLAKKDENVAARVWLNIKQKLPRRVVSIVVFMIPVYIAVFILNAMGLFDITRQWLAGVVVTTIIPIEALSVIVLSFAAEFTSGFAAAGAMLDAGVLTTKQTALALFIGNIVAFPMRAVRHQLPRYIGIFAPKMGTQLLLLGQGYRVVSLILVGVIYYAFY